MDDMFDLDGYCGPIAERWFVVVNGQIRTNWSFESEYDARRDVTIAAHLGCFSVNDIVTYEKHDVRWEPQPW